MKKSMSCECGIVAEGIGGIIDKELRKNQL